jgi:hypothetical protein
MPRQDFESLVRSLNPALARCLLTGEPRCLDAYNRPTTITNGVWRRNGKGWWFGNTLKYGTVGGGAIIVPNSGAAPEVQVTSGTVFWTVRDTQADVINAQVFNIQDAGGRRLSIYNGNVNRVTVYDGTNVPSLNYAGLGTAKSCAVRFVTGTTPSLFTDGVYRVNGGVTPIVPVDNDADVYMGNHVALNGQSHRTDYGFFALFNDAILGRAITDQEIAQLHDAWMGIVSVFTPERTISIPRNVAEVIGRKPAVELRGKVTSAGLLLDVSGNGRDAVVSGMMTHRSDRGQEIHSGWGRGGANGPLAQTAVDSALYPSAWSVAFRLLVRSTGEGGEGRLFMIDHSGATRAYLDFNGAPVTTARYFVQYSDGTAEWSFLITPNVWHHVVIVHTKASPTNLPIVYLNGESVTVSVVTAKSGTLSTATNARLELMNEDTPSAALMAFDGDITDFAIIPAALTAAEARALYVANALASAQRLANRTSYPVSVAAVAAGGMAGPWRLLSGSMKWDDNGTRRRLVATTGGYIVSRNSSSQAYGAWYCRMTKGSGAFGYMPLMASKPSPLGYDGYTLGVLLNGTVFIIKHPVGSTVAATVAGAVAVGVDYEYFVTRQSVATADGHAAGYFTVWIRGGVYTSWTSLLTGTDNGYTTSNGLNGLVDTAGTLSDFTTFPDGAGLLPTDVPGLED